MKTELEAKRSVKATIYNKIAGMMTESRSGKNPELPSFVEASKRPAPSQLEGCQDFRSGRRLNPLATCAYQTFQSTWLIQLLHICINCGWLPSDKSSVSLFG